MKKQRNLLKSGKGITASRLIPNMKICVLSDISSNWLEASEVR
tara:strand:- start:1135 stop:1263 length:129 start_codon:yes stop_codon:yes gene_type:complete